MKLVGKKAIVTGASKGIGKAIALAFALEGADVVISYRNDQQGALETVQEMQKLGRKSKAIVADFSNIQEIEMFFDQAVTFLGKIDLLVNNAAAYDTSSFFELSVEQFEYVLKVSVIAPMYLTQLTAKHMKKENIFGSILNISSITGNRPYPCRTAHATAKSALNMLTKSLALELAPYHIRVNAIAPGNTPYDESAVDEQEIIREIPLKRAGKTEDQSFGALYLVSDEGTWITGHILTIDGGQSLAF